MLKNTFKYKDPLIDFTKKVLKQVDLFRNLRKSSLYDFIYQVISKKTYEEGDIILKPGEIVNFMFYI